MMPSLFALRIPLAAVVLAGGLLACSSPGALAPDASDAAAGGDVVPAAPDLAGDRTTPDVVAAVDSAPPVSCFGPAPEPIHTAKIAASALPAPPPNPSPLPPSVAWGDPRRLPSAALANRLSQLLWRAPADDALLAKVAACPNITGADLTVLVQQMLADDRAVAGLQAFFTWWLTLDNITRITPDATVFPGVTPQLLQSMADEPRRFGVDVVRGADPSLPSLLASSFSFVDGRLAPLYGLQGTDANAPFQKVLFNTASLRAGILTMPGILAQGAKPTHTAPYRRSLFVRQRILCQPIPPPPPGIVDHDSEPIPAPGQTWRQALEATVARTPACTACHFLLRVGFAFENFDALGRLRGTDNGAVIDASGLLSIDGKESPYGGPVDLAIQLSAAPETSDCFARQWLAFAMNLRDELDLDDRQRAALTPAIQGFRSQGLDIRALIAMVANSAPFLAPN